MAFFRAIDLSRSPTLGDKPNQPKNFAFPKRSYGKAKITNRAFQQKWFERWRWLHYDSVGDKVFCYLCIITLKTGKMKPDGNIDEAFVVRGYSNWKDASGDKGGFSSHECSSVHKRAVEVIETLPRTTLDIGEQLSSSHVEEKLQNRSYLLKVFQTIQFLSRQSLALRGDQNDQESNFVQLMKLRGRDDPNIIKHLEQSTDKYTCHQVQNEMIQIMALTVLRKVSEDFHSSTYFSLMADEVTDASNREQVVICLRRVDESFEPQEEFIGLYKVDETSANTITKALSDVLQRMDLSVLNCRGQCYDGTANMSGIRQGTAAQFLLQEPRALYNHCYGHALNLAVGDTIKNIRLLRDTLDTCFEMSKLLKYSPKRDSAFEALRLQLAPSNPGFRTLCPTRWTVRATALNSIYQNFIVLKEFWDQARDFSVDSECRARIIGVQAQMTQFSFLFGLVIAEHILQHTDNLSKTLQNPNLTAAEGEKIAYLTRSTLLRMRSDDNYDLLWERILKLRAEFGVYEATIPRKRKVPARYEDGTAEPEYSPTPKSYYKQIYYETIDLISSFILQRFDQPGLKTYKILQDLLLSAAKGVPYDEELNVVTNFYKDDFNEASLNFSHLDTVRLKKVVNQAFVKLLNT